MIVASKFGQVYELTVAGKPYLGFENIACLLELTCASLHDTLVHEYNGHKGLFGKDVHFETWEDAESAADWATGRMLARIIKRKRLA